MLTMQPQEFSCKLYPYKALFSPVKCGNITIKNRIAALAPGFDEKLILSLAAGGVGLICAGELPVIPNEDKLCRAKSVTAAAHGFGANIFASVRLPKILLTPAVQLAAISARLAGLCGFDGLCIDVSEACGGADIALIKGLRRHIGDAFPIMCRIQLNDFKTESLWYISELIRAGADMLSIKAPDPVCRGVREYLCSTGIVSNRGEKLPVLAELQLSVPDDAESSVSVGTCDAVLLSKSILADPDWCRKAYAGRSDEIRPCISCKSCFSPCVLDTGLHDAALTAAKKPKRIAVIGSGIAGMSFAMFAAKRGHLVELAEPCGRLAEALGTDRLAKYRHWLIIELSRLENVEIRLNARFDTDYLEGCRFDALVYATGDASEYLAAQSAFIAPEVYCLGAAYKSDDVPKLTRAAYELAGKI